MRIITGCSRSGTSFVSQALHHLGGDFGEAQDLIEADRWNRRGYFENRTVGVLNHRLLFGRWSNPKLWVDVMWPRNPLIRLRKLATIAAGPLATRRKAVLRRAERLSEEIAELGASLQGKIVKDPRFCYLMDPWVASGAVHSVLFVLRHPWEAASSMSRQTKLPLALTYKGWIDSIEKFWDSPPAVPVHLVDFNAFFDPEGREAEMQTLCRFLGLEYSGAIADEVLDQVLDGKLRTREASEVRLPKKVERLYQSLLERKGER